MAIKYLFMDVDGTLTDGKIYMGEQGEIFKAFNIKDGCGIKDILIPSGIQPAIITGRISRIVENRCKELSIKKLYQGISDKLTKLKELIAVDHIEPYEIAYIGDDINDLPCISYLKVNGGLTACPADAVPKVKETCFFICNAKGGNGAVREFIEYLVDFENEGELCLHSTEQH